MTYLPTKPITGTATAGPLDDANLLPLTQAGVAKQATLATLKSFLLGSAAAPAPTGATSGGSTGTATGSTAPTGSTSTGSTASTGSTGGGTVATTAPAGRIGYPANTTAVKNTATAPVAVTFPSAPTCSLPAFTPFIANESANGTVIDKTNYTSQTITCGDGTTLGLTASTAASRAGKFTIMRNGAVMSGGRLDLLYGVGSKPALGAFDDAIQMVYYFHSAYVMTDHGYGAQTWFKIEGSGPDLDTDSGDPRQSFLIADAVAPVGDPPYGLGVHCASIGDEPRFTNWTTEFKNSIGTPAYVNAFLDFDFSSWDNGSFTAARALAASAPAKNAIPVTGMPLAGQFAPNSLQYFLDIAAGVYDANITAVVNNWFGLFDELHVRPGYEFNGKFMPWYAGSSGDTTSLNAWVAAFQHVYTQCHAAADAYNAAHGTKKVLLVVWNPASIAYEECPSPDTFYPGNAFCDYHGLDTYSPNYALDDKDWATGGFAPHTTDPNLDDKQYWQVQKALNPVNRVHFWDYPDATQYALTGNGSGWGMQRAIAFAKANGKALSFPECGAGANFGDSGIGPVEDPEFAFYLRSRVDQMVNEGVPFLYLNIWCADEGDGGWGSLYRQRVRQQNAWSSAFGGTGAALKYQIIPGSGAATSTGTSGGMTTGTTTPPAGSSGPATAIVTDTAGKSATLSLENPPVPNTSGSFHTFYGSGTGLLTNINWFVGGDGNLYLDGTTDSDLASAVVTKNGVPVTSLIPNSTYN